MEYEKYIYEFLNGDLKTNEYVINYLSGRNIVALGKDINFPYQDYWEGPNFSRWEYMKKLIDYYEKQSSLGDFFHMYFIKNIKNCNNEKSQKLFLIKLNLLLSSYGQEVKILKGKITIVSHDVKEFLSKDIDKLSNFADSEKSDNTVFLGGMSKIISTNKDSILKKILLNFDSSSDEDKQRIKNEFDIMKNIYNENYILPVLEYYDNEFSFTMKRAIIFEDKEKLMDDFELIFYIINLLQSLQYIFSKNVFHRDLSIDNVLYYHGRWVLADFGVAKQDKQNLTKTGKMYFKEKYIHPELKNNPKLWKIFSPKYDLFSANKIVENDILPKIKNLNVKKEIKNQINLWPTKESGIFSAIKEISKNIWILIEEKCV